jgi:integrator complex subunit 11
MKVKSMSFSAHADCKGIMQLIKHTQPRHVVFVHGEKKKMIDLGKVVNEETGIPVYCPANFQKLLFQPKKTFLSLGLPVVGPCEVLSIL